MICISDILSGIIANGIYDKIKGLFKGLHSFVKPGIVCRIFGTGENLRCEKSLRTKTSDSDYGIEFYNLSDKQYFLDYFEIFNGKQPIVGPCEFSEDEQQISAHKKIKYILMEQDADTLCWHCEREHFTKCIMHIYTIDGKDIKVKLDISSIAFMIELGSETGIVYD